MNRVSIWFERKFEFTFPVELHPNLCARLRGTPAPLEEIVRGSSRDVLVRKPQEKWSAQEHAGHLVDLEPLWMTRVGDYLAGGSELTAADLKIEPALFARAMLHPRLKQPMRLVDHLYFVAEHDDHHLACIWELINVSSEST